MKQTLLAAALSLALSAQFAPVDALAAPVAAKAAAKADARFQAIYKAEWQWRVKQRLAWDEDEPRDVRDALPKVDARTQAARLAMWEGVLRQLDGIRAADLSRAEQINHAVYRAQIAAFVAAQRFREYEQPVNADSAFWSDIAYIARRPLKNAEEYRAYLAQLADLPRYFGQELDNMRAGLARGFTPPQVTLAGRDAPLLNIVNAKAPEDTVWYTPFKEMPATISMDEQARLRAQGIALIGSAVKPAYAQALQFFRDEYVPKARTTLAAERLPDGKAYYQSKIVEYTTTDMTAQQIHQIGLSEMAKIRADMQQTMVKAGFKGDLPAFLAFLRSDPQFYAKTPEELLMRAAWISKKFDGKADQYFGYLPRRRFAIVPVPPDQAPYYTSARGGPGIYLVNTYNLPARALYSLPALTLHESAPGHAFQMPVALEQQGVPPFRRAYISAYGEGWALYCERLGSEMGMYETPYETFGMLSYQAWRASRLVVDTGIHALGWTREQAQAYLHDNTALSDHEIETEVDRYISWPGQALSYYLGEMAIVESRRKAEAALGDRFDIRAFHDTVLQLGAVPLPVLKARIDTFIADGGKSPYEDVKRPASK
ncbi:hypothetical protein ASD28_14755 [Massilia sp. Root133]|uniref:DUF885 domain-containing protein n=1 Tax=unclassified Massilia TaxID=2609279 RepID=UPI0006F83B48|nr:MULTISPECIES: DUF885 family protein [unclassified Massilia]KQX98359.1 hypothetical protein ASD28_14755 [Massilia sp. Root133]KQZ47045.1 hypothetical protein ASD92_24650 [Massilia sp. Root1485]